MGEGQTFTCPKSLSVDKPFIIFKLINQDDLIFEHKLSMKNTVIGISRPI